MVVWAGMVNKNELNYSIVNKIVNPKELEIPEVQEVTMSNVCTNEQNDTLLLINNYSSINKLIHNSN